eukprot:scaffold71393_cov23-Tisochrysis_lutea.AAC.1
MATPTRKSTTHVTMRKIPRVIPTLSHVRRSRRALSFIALVTMMQKMSDMQCASDFGWAGQRF